MKSFMRRVNLMDGGSHMGLFVFGNETLPESIIELDADLSNKDILTTIDQIQHRPLQNMLMIKTAVDQFVDMFNSNTHQESSKPKMVLLFTDTSMNYAGYENITELLHEQDIFLHIITLGAKPEDRYPIVLLTDHRIRVVDSYAMLMSADPFSHPECGMYLNPRSSLIIQLITYHSLQQFVQYDLL